jgi:hypothetical protein
LINVVLNGLVSSGVIAGFRTNYETREEPDALRITMTRADGASAAAVQAEVLKALRQVGEGAEIHVELSPEIEITGEVPGLALDRRYSGTPEAGTLPRASKGANASTLLRTR